MSNVNNSPLHSKTAEQILRERGISLNSFAIHRQYTICPKCSSDRKKKKAECLAVTIEDDRVHWFCNHCGDKGYEFYEQKQNVKQNPLEVYYLYSATLRKVRAPGKKFYWQHREGTEWKSGTGGAATKDLLYRYDGIKAALASGKPIAIVEGEQDADNLWKLGIAATCNAHGAGKWSTELSAKIAGATNIVVIFQDNDEVGINHASKILKSLEKTTQISRVDLRDHWETIPDHGDISDYIAAGFDAKALFDAAVNDSKGTKAKSGNGHTALSEDEIAAMAAMSPIELAQAIKQIAANKGVPQAAVKQEYKAKANDAGLITSNHGKRKIEIPDIEAHPDPVTDDLLADIAKLARTYLILPKHGDVIVALWTVFTYVPRVYRIAPRLQITAPEKRCGKTTLLNFLHEVVYRRIKTGNVSTAAFFRVVEGYHPTLLIDEMDTFMNKDEDIRNVLNEGHEINGCVIRCEKIADNFEPVPFSCFAPVAYAHIGKLPKDMGMLLDRSIAIHLARRMAKEKVMRLDQMDEQQCGTLRRKIRRWCDDNEDNIKHAMDGVDLSGVNDRVRDNWRPLLAIAKVAGRDWFDKAIAAIANPDEEGSIGEMWLKDMRDMFERLDLDFIIAGHVVANLNALEERPWSEMGYRGAELSPKGLSKIAREFGVKPRHDTTKSSRGYYRSDLEPLFERYLDNAYEDGDAIIYSGKPVIAVQPIDESTDKYNSDCCPPDTCLPSEQVQQKADDPDGWSFQNG